MPPTPRSWAPLHCSSFAELEESFATRVLGKGNLAAHAVGACLGYSFADRLRPSVAIAYYQPAIVARQNSCCAADGGRPATRRR